MKKIVLLAVISAFMTSCGAHITRGDQYPKMYETKPLTLLVMPPINNTVNVDAKELLYTSISKPLAEAGYYVISPYLGMAILKAESAYDAELFRESSLTMFRTYFGADAVIFSEINKWEKGLSSIRAGIRYFIRDARSGEIIFDRTCDMKVNIGSSSSGWLGLITSAVETALTDHIIAARKANAYIFNDMPRGKYDAQYMKDMDVRANLKDLNANVQ